jgi:hypothetical protein
LFCSYCSIPAIAQSADDTTRVPYTTDSFSISYPKNWILNTNGFGGTRFYLLSPSHGGQRTAISLSTQSENNCEVNGDSMLRINLEQLPLAIDNYSYVSSRVLREKGKEGFEVVFTGSQSGNPRKWKQRGFCAQGSTYILTYIAVPESYDHFEKLADEIMSSLNFTR